MIRLSVGIEEIEDLLEDLDQAFNAVKNMEKTSNLALKSCENKKVGKSSKNGATKKISKTNLKKKELNGHDLKKNGKKVLGKKVKNAKNGVKNGH